MKKYQILFDWPVSQINHLADSTEAETFAEHLNDPDLTTFTSLTEEMRGIGVDLVKAKAERSHFSDWSKLIHCIDSFERHFSSFPGAEFKKFQIFAVLASKLAETGVALDNAEIDQMLFEFRNLPSQLPQCWFVHENISHFENSLVVFSSFDLSTLEREFDLTASNISPTLVFHTLAALVRVGDFSMSHKALVKQSAAAVPDEGIQAFVHLTILASGKPVHVPRRYSALPHVVSADNMNPENSYHQWNEVLSVLSEYNTRDEILLKFLTIYHVFENLMFKRPIVKLEREQNGRMFSIRDFRRMYEQVDMAEAKALTKLFTGIFSINATSSTAFEQRVIQKWRALSSIVSVVEIETALREVKIKKKYSEFKAGNQSAAYFTELVYSLRCAIVHNKETEFHLTYASLSAGFLALIEAFLLPCLEEICFAILGVPNSEVWYENQFINLY